ncbi:hypothetical protein [Mycolicibacter algericus]
MSRFLTHPIVALVLFVAGFYGLSGCSPRCTARCRGS